MIFPDTARASTVWFRLVERLRVEAELAKLSAHCAVGLRRHRVA